MIINNFGTNRIIPGELKMKLNNAFLLYTFGIVSLVIGIIQLVNESTLEAILSLVYSIVFL